MSRLFTFGCSCTAYNWPTWANIIGKEFDFFENWGLIGAGNQYIANTIVEASVRHNITKDDTVVVMWTSCTREDRYTDEWVTAGNLYMHSGKLYTQEFITKYVTPRGTYIRDLPTIHMTDRYLESLGCNYQMLCMNELIDFNTKTHGTLHEVGINKRQLSKLFGKDNLKSNPDQVDDVIELYKPVLDKIKQPSISSVVSKYNLQQRRRDNHPYPLEHLKFVEEVLPDFKVSEDTRLWIADINNSLDQSIPMQNWSLEDNRPARRL